MNIVNNVCIKAGYVEKRDKPPNIVSEYYIGQDMKYCHRGSHWTRMACIITY